MPRRAEGSTPRRELTDDERDAHGEHLAGDGAGPGPAMTGAPELKGMQLPPPDLAKAYAQLPKPWQVGAVLLADRILAAAYADDVLSCAVRIAQDLQGGAVRGMTLPEYVDEAAAGHPRVVDTRRALHCLAYSPSVRLPVPPRWRLEAPRPGLVPLPPGRGGPARCDGRRHRPRLAVVPQEARMDYWYRLEGRTPVLDPAHRLQPISERRIARTQITPEVSVSTVFLGLDHRYTADGPPVLFETMVFGLDQEGDEPQERYATYEAAEAGHARWVAWARDAT